jgi:hypothetical protein
MPAAAKCSAPAAAANQFNCIVSRTHWGLCSNITRGGDYVVGRTRAALLHFSTIARHLYIMGRFFARECNMQQQDKIS